MDKDKKEKSKSKRNPLKEITKNRTNLVVSCVFVW